MSRRRKPQSDYTEKRVADVRERASVASEAVVSLLRLDKRFADGFSVVALEQELEALLGVGPLDDPEVWQASRRCAYTVFARLWYAGEIREEDEGRDCFVFASPVSALMLKEARSLQRFDDTAPSFALHSGTTPRTPLLDALRREHKWCRTLKA